MKNSEYWKDRMVQLELNALKKGEAYYKNLQEQYDKAIHNINNDITIWYERLAKNNEISLVEAKKLLDKNELKEFHWTLQDYIQYGKENAINQEWMKELENASAKHHINKLQSLQIQMKQHLEKLSNEQNKGMKNTLSNIYEDTYYHTAFEIQKGFNAGWSFDKLDTKRIEKVLNMGWADGKNFSDRIWTNKEKLVSTLNTELTQMIIRGEGPDRAIKAVSAKMGVSKKQAGRLVMTESSMIASLSQKDSLERLGVKEYEIVETLDMKTCEECGHLDGVHLPLKDFRVGETAPPFHPVCRGCIAPYFDDDEGTRIARDEEGKNYYVDSNMRYDDWKEKFVENASKKVYNELGLPEILNKVIKEQSQQLHPKVERFIDTNLKNEDIIEKSNCRVPFSYSKNEDKIIINIEHNDIHYYQIDEAISHEIIHMKDVRENVTAENYKKLKQKIDKAKMYIENNYNYFYHLVENNSDSMALSDIISALTKGKMQGDFGRSDVGYWDNDYTVIQEVTANILSSDLVDNKIIDELLEQLPPLKEMKGELKKLYGMEIK